MVYVKAAIATTLVLLFALLGYIYFANDESYEINKALDDFQKGDYGHAETLVKKLEKSIPPSEYNLYRAYIAREKKQLEESNKFLTKALGGPIDKSESVLRLEIYLNIAYNGYLLRNPALMTPALQEASKLSTDKQQWVLFLQGADEYLKMNYAAALEDWGGGSEPAPLSRWMEAAFSKTFTPLWLTLHKARCDIEGGQYLTTRDMLEELSSKNDAQESGEIHFLLGLTYIKEAETHSPSAALPYYRLAFSQFNHVPILSDRYAADREEIIKGLYKNASELIAAHTLEGLPFYINILDSWQARAELNDIAKKITALIEQEAASSTPGDLYDFVNVINHMVPEGETRQAVRAMLESDLDNALATNNAENIQKYWESARLFSLSPAKLKQSVIQALETKVLFLLSPGTDNTAQVSPLLSLWKKLQANPQQRTAFESKIIAVGTRVWEKGNPEQGLADYKLAVSASNPDEGQAVADALSMNVRQLYTWAQKEQKSDQLPYLLKAVKEFHLVLEIGTPEEITDLLADGEEMLKDKQYQEALGKAIWILTLEPQNQSAISLAALASYHLNNYPQALQYFKEVKSPDQHMEEAMAISQVLGGSPAQGLAALNKIQLKRPLKKDNLLRLAYGSLTIGQPAEAISWLDKISPEDDETRIAKVFAFDQLKDWNQLLEAYGKINMPYRNLTSVQAMAIDAYTALGKVDEAERIIGHMLEQNPPPNTQAFSSAYQEYNAAHNKSLGRHFIAGIFYYKVKGDYKKALEYFSKIEDPSPEAYVYLAGVHLALNNADESLNDLNRALSLSKGQPSEEEVRKLALTLLAETYSRLKDYAESASYFLRYFELQPQDEARRGPYADVLMQLHRYDLAAEQYAFLEKAGKLALEQKLSYFQALYRLGDFQKANTLAQHLIEQRPPLPLLDQLRLAQGLVITQDFPFVGGVLDAASNKKDLGVQESIELIKLYTLLGKYGQAQNAAKSMKGGIEKSPEGLMALAQLEVRLDDFDEAIAHARLAVKLDPQNPRAVHFLETFQRTPRELQSDIQSLQDVLASGKAPAKDKLLYARDLIDQALELKLLPVDAGQAVLSNLQKARTVLEKLTDAKPEIPEVFFLLGQIQFLLGQNENAVQAYLRAIQLNPSDVEASKYLALAYIHQGKPQAAIKALLGAARFAPDDAEVWQQLAGLYQNTGDELNAVQAWENAAKYAPADEHAYVSLAKLELQLENPDKARQVLDKALKLSPKSVPVLKMLLVALYDPNLRLTESDPAKIAERQRAVYRALHELDPQAAETLLHELKQNKEP